MATTNENDRRSSNRSIDRLSYLPDDILIGIISLLPFQLAIATGTLSRRWRGLWSNTTSIDIAFRETYKLLNLDTTLNETMRQITSPFIHSFSIDFKKSFDLNYWAPLMDIVIRDVCNRNVHQLKVTWRDAACWYKIYTLPSVIFQTQSLVSIELGSKSGSYDDWRFPEDCDTINLPNLKNLTIHFGLNYQWIEKLVKACPSLVKLSLNCWVGYIVVSLQSGRFVINAPNLEYLAIFAPKSMCFSFEEEPIVLRETKIEFTDLHQYQSDKDKLSRLYKAVSNVRILTIDISAVDALSTVLHNVTRLTINMKSSHSLNTLLSLLKMCPKVDVLTLKVWGVDNYKEPLYRNPGNVSTSRRALRRIKSINVEIDNWRTYCKPAKSLSRLIVHLLRSTCNLEHFNLRVNDFHQDWDWLPSANCSSNQEHELKLCKKLYRWPTISSCCDVEFNGRFFKMSRKDGPKITTTNGEAIYFHPSRKGLIYKEK
ncbi:FBD-associated F-box protein At2g26860-like [Silene latifolia]|uniref:FBD-associated F-box protein At2g26860-like n=1 Tax=Silene latifolia TaxID=37657 RepID=UPI003D76B4E5